MNIAIEAEPAPLRVDEHGATPEVIIQMYDSLTLADTYGAIGYYLRHPETVAEYLAERERGAEEIRAKFETVQPDMAEMRRRLIARREGNARKGPQ